jgi:class 3 adenylate cyclase
MIGNTVNVAARLGTLIRQVDDILHVYADGSTRDRLSAVREGIFDGGIEVQVKGKQVPLKIYHLEVSG